jgi:hypothetical protein
MSRSERPGCSHWTDNDESLDGMQKTLDNLTISQEKIAADQSHKNVDNIITGLLGTKHTRFTDGLMELQMESKKAMEIQHETAESLNEALALLKETFNRLDSLTSALRNIQKDSGEQTFENYLSIRNFMERNSMHVRNESSILDIFSSTRVEVEESNDRHLYEMRRLQNEKKALEDEINRLKAADIEKSKKIYEIIKNCKAKIKKLIQNMLKK